MQRKVPVVISRIIAYSDDVKLFRLKPQKKIPAFNSGQFLHFALDPYDPSYNWPDSRVFSIASSSSRKNEVDIIVSKKGAFTTRMMEQLREGDEAWIKLPYGSFNFSDTDPPGPVVLIAGGTGISPFIPYLNELADGNSRSEVFLYYGIKNQSLLIISEILDRLARSGSTFRCNLYVKKPDDTWMPHAFSTGILPVEEIVKECIPLDNPGFYLSGPESMIQAFIAEMSGAGIDKKRIRYDEWQ